MLPSPPAAPTTQSTPITPHNHHPPPPCRLPPHPAQLRPQGPAPTYQDRVACRGKGLFVLIPITAPPELEAQDPSAGGGGYVKLCTPLHNDRLEHMMPPEGEGLLRGWWCTAAAAGMWLEGVQQCSLYGRWAVGVCPPPPRQQSLPEQSCVSAGHPHQQ